MKWTFLIWVSCLQLLNTVCFGQSETEITCLIEKAEFYILKNIDSAYYFAHKAIIIFSRLNFAEHEGKAHILASEALIEKGDLITAETHLIKTLSISSKLKDAEDVFQLYNNLGALYYKSKRFPLALEYYLHAQKVIPENNIMKRITLFNNLSLIYTELGQYNKALEELQKNLEINQLQKDKSGESIALNNIGSILYHQQKYNEALGYFTKSLNLKISIKDTLLISKQYLNIGRTYLVLKNYTEARKNLKTAISWGIQNKITHTEIHARSLLSELELEINNIDEAEEEAQNALRLANELKNEQWIKELSLQLSKIYSQNKNFEKSQFYLSLYKTSDSLFSVKKDSVFVLIRSLQPSEAQQPQENNSWAFAISLSAAIITLLTLITYTSKRKKVALENTNNTTANNQTEEKATSTEMINSLEYLTVQNNEGNYLLKIEDIYFITIENRKCFVAGYNQKYKINKTLNELEKLLPSKQFIRINRSTLINLEKMVNYSFWEYDKFIVRMSNEEKSELIMTRDRYKENLEPLQKNLKKD